MIDFTFNDEERKLLIWFEDVLVAELTYEFLMDQINGTVPTV